jgi:uncharacterized SAM-dependent methyltransferase
MITYPKNRPEKAAPVGSLEENLVTPPGSFLTDCVALFSGEKVAHMGVHQYKDHAGMRNGRSVSGGTLWAEADEERMEMHRKGLVNKAGLEIDLLQEVAATISIYVPKNICVIELGPGTLGAFQSKTLPILKALDRRECTIVDSSPAFLKNICREKEAMNLTIKPVEDDFFLSSNIYQETSDPALLCSFGGIISNLIAPKDTSPPQELLTVTLKIFAEKINSGWILLSFDSEADEREIVDYYKKHALFQLNVFDRMVVELPIERDFDPNAFEYVPLWIPSSRQLAHCAETARMLSFAIGSRSFVLPKGERLHLKNSFKFSTQFFEACCADASLTVEHHWSASNSHAYLLKK